MRPQKTASLVTFLTLQASNQKGVGSYKKQRGEQKVGSKKCSDTSANIIESAIALTVYMHAQCQLHSQEKPGKRGKGFVFPCTFS